MKVGGIKTWKELTIGVQQLVRLLFNNNLINPGLVLLLLNFFTFLVKVQGSDLTDGGPPR